MQFVVDKSSFDSGLKNEERGLKIMVGQCFVNYFLPLH